MVNASHPQNIAQSLIRLNLNPKNWLEHLKKLGLPIAAISFCVLEETIFPLIVLLPYLQQQKLLEQSQEKITQIQNQTKTVEENIAQALTQSALDNQRLEGQIKPLLTIPQELQEYIEQLEKHNKKIQTTDTRFRLQLSAVQKLQQQQKITTAKVTRQEQELEANNQKLTELNLVNSQQQSTQKPTPIPFPQPKKIYGYASIDGNNLGKCAQEIGLEIDWKKFKVYLADLANNADIFSLRYYTGAKTCLTTNQKQWFNHLKQLQYEVNCLPIAEYSNGKCKTVGDDMQIGVDLMQDVRAGDNVILVTGDGDFFPLVDKLLARNAKVTVIGSMHHTSHRLKELNQKNFLFISLESIKDKIIKLKK